MHLLSTRHDAARRHAWLFAPAHAYARPSSHSCLRSRVTQSGVDLDNAGDFLKNGASSVGLVAPLFPPDAVAGEKWDVIQANARKVIGNVKAAMA